MRNAGASDVSNIGTPPRAESVVIAGHVVCNSMPRLVSEAAQDEVEAGQHILPERKGHHASVGRSGRVREEREGGGGYVAVQLDTRGSRRFQIIWRCMWSGLRNSNCMVMRRCIASSRSCGLHSKGTDVAAHAHATHACSSTLSVAKEVPRPVLTCS